MISGYDLLARFNSRAKKELTLAFISLRCCTSGQKGHGACKVNAAVGAQQSGGTGGGALVICPDNVQAAKS